MIDFYCCKIDAFLNSSAIKSKIGSANSLAKQSLPTMLYSCLIGINESEKEAWKLYRNEKNDPEFNHWHKVAALRVLIDINKSKFRMFQDGPAFMEISRLQGEMDKIKKEYLNGKDNSFKPLVKSPLATSYDEAMRFKNEGEEHKQKCNLRHIDDVRSVSANMIMI